ncbi:pyridoxamine 5'-phosphate oxidase family protein [Amycolatopsis jiangsuensis]|uniref:Pyridoxamine 5'-phosphate oxidase n=1 Tax=Amycolatopsis jiangsuensis TaxID=1181879 RepID=A0A840IQA9_9PSEU|nr:pyridoxamine 5'-phosphate oxidase family protein [Amycolatopsis jiangsuensis]MBB4684090.1 hypothetical protein [Amycolatopsis jiangsuensis]
MSNASTDAGSLTTEDREFLRCPLYGFLSMAGGPVPAQPRPVWFEVTDNGLIQLFSLSGSPKVRQAHRDPRASIVVAAPVGERDRWVSVAGHVALESEGAAELATRLAARYWDLGDASRAGDLAGMLAADLVRLVLHPESVRRGP